MDCAKLMDKFGIYFDEIGLSKTYGRCFWVVYDSEGTHIHGTVGRKFAN